jgi:hypothetical protein
MNHFHARDVKVLIVRDLFDLIGVSDEHNLSQTCYLGIQTCQHDLALVPRRNGYRLWTSALGSLQQFSECSSTHVALGPP